jgi:hypothetical protein
MSKVIKKNSREQLVNVRPFDTGVVNLTYDRLHRRKQ